MSRLATIPHAPIERVNHATGAVEPLEPGSFVNLAAATGIFARVAQEGAAVVVQLPACDWVFSVGSDERAVEWARKLNAIAVGASR